MADVSRDKPAARARGRIGGPAVFAFVVCALVLWAALADRQSGLGGEVMLSGTVLVGANPYDDGEGLVLRVPCGNSTVDYMIIEEGRGKELSRYIGRTVTVRGLAGQDDEGGLSWLRVRECRP